jgi:hypothetical protein
MKFTIAGSAAAVCAVAAVATAPLAVASPDDDFLKALADSGIPVPASIQPQVINGGHQVCKFWSQSQKPKSEDVIGAVAKAANLNNDQATVLVRAATTVYCPKYKSQL